jgi:NACHT domain
MHTRPRRARSSFLCLPVARPPARARARFDEAWFERLLARLAGPAGASEASRASHLAETGPTSQGTPLQWRQDWGEAPDVGRFVNRTEELALLRDWVLAGRCRLLALLGMGGIGKTSLAAKLAQDVASGFERVYWRSLRDAQPASEWLAGAIGFLSDHQVAPPATAAERLTVLLQLLRERRCLLVLDNLEALLEPGATDGRYQAGLGEYRHLLQALGGAAHESCVVLTSREAPAELSALVGGAVRTLRLGGLNARAVQVVLAPQQLVGTSKHWTELTARLGGNPRALKMVGASIGELFGGDIGAFLDEAGAHNVFGGVRRLLAEQVERSSATERHVLRVLAAERELVTVSGLLAALGPRFGRSAVLAAIEVLGRRSLIECAETPGAAAFTLPAVVLEYVVALMVENTSGENDPPVERTPWHQVVPAAA